MSTLLEMLSREKFIFQTFDDTPAKRKSLARIFYGTLSEHKDELRILNTQGAGIYFTVNESKSSSRKKEDINKARAIWIDSDNEEVIMPPLSPSVVVNTSPGKHHFYWIFSKPLEDLEAWDSLQNTMVEQYGSDPSAKDRSRVLRVPGFYHMKDPANPFLVTEEYRHNSYSPEVLIKQFGLTPIRNIFEKGQSPTKSSLDIAISNIIDGSNYNDSLGTLTQHFANKRYSPYFITTITQALLENTKADKNDRWHARVNHLPTQVETAIEKAKVPELKTKPKIVEEVPGIISTEFPLPPGRTGEIARNVLEFMKFPSEEIATITALHTISTFAGRRFSFNGKGLTTRRILLAPQGRGKNTTNRYLQAVVSALKVPPSDGTMPRLIDADKFMINGDFTAVRPIHLELEDFATRSMIVSEAGQVGKSKAGDKDSFKAYVLQMLSMSTHESILPKHYSIKKSESGLKPVYNPCAVILHESVPQNYAEVLKEGNEFTDGSMSRSDLIYIGSPRDIATKNRSFHSAKVSTPVLDFLAELAHTCVKNIPEEGTIPLLPEQMIYADWGTPTLQARMDKLDDEIDEKLNATSSDIEESLLVRRTERFYITCLILAIADTNFIDSNSRPIENPKVVITDEHVDWVNKYQDALELTVKNLAKQGAFADPLYVACNEVTNLLERTLENPGKTYLNTFPGCSQAARDNQVFTRSFITVSLSHNTAIDRYTKEVCYGDRIRAITNILNELESQGSIKVYWKKDMRFERDARDRLGVTVSGDLIRYLYKVEPI